VDAVESPSFFARHEFLLRRLHSLSGLIPVGAYMIVHLLTNASVLNGPATFQLNVYRIHSLGFILPLVEWTFIFIPILFHGIFGMVIVFGGVPNTTSYPYEANVRYYLQRITGVIAFIFIFLHVFHLHGWFHAEWWLEHIARPFGGAQFRPYSAASTTAAALQNGLVVSGYFIGVTASVFHLANGIWTMGITWGAWTSPAAQKRAEWVCGAFGVLLLTVGLGALFGMNQQGHGEALERAKRVEDKLYEHRVEAGIMMPNAEKRSESEPREEEVATGKTE